MTLDDIYKICKSLEDVTEDLKWGHDLCFCIGGKMFFVTEPDKQPVSDSFKTVKATFNELIERQGISPAPYVG